MRLSTLCTAAACVVGLSACADKVVGPGGTASSVVLAPSQATFLVRDTLRLLATVLDANGEQLTYRIIEWASSDPSVATVSSGLVTGVARGSVTIYAAAEAFADSAVLTVVEPFHAVMVDAGPGLTCAVTAAEEAYCWGDSWGGKLGNGLGYGAVRRPSLVYGGIHWASVTAGQGGYGSGSGFACGVSTGGTAYCWGNNDGAVFGSYTPEKSYSPLALPDSGPVLSVVASPTYSCVLGIGRVRCFTEWWSDIFPGTYPVPPALQTLTTGGDHLCGLTTTGTAYCWGENTSGQLGDGTTTPQYWPAPLPGDRSYASIDAGRNGTCAVDIASGGWCWGSNDQGQLGDGTLINRPSPTPILGGITFRMISAGDTHSCAVSTTGLAYCWGANDHGELGDGTVERRLAPVQVVGGLRFSTISTGLDHTCGVTDKGLVYCWGANAAGQLGDESTTNRAIPVAVWTP